MAQTSATLDLGASIAEYQGFLPSGAAVLATAIRHDAAAFSLGAAGSLTVFESGNEIVQGTAAGAWLLGSSRRPWRVELAGAVGASRYAAEANSGHLLARTNFHVIGERTGGWAGFTTGRSFADSTQTPLELATTVWHLYESFTFTATLAHSRLSAHHHTDLTGTMRWTRPPFELDVRGGVRPSSTRATGAFGDVALLIKAMDRVSIAIGAGRFPADPVRGLLPAKYLNAAVRFDLSGTRTAPSVIAAPRTQRATTVDAGDPPALDITGSGSVRRIGIYAPRATVVELMGDFTDWAPVSLEHRGGGQWEVHLPLAPGVHRINVRIDGGEWIVPSGARLERNEFGATGVIVVR